MLTQVATEYQRVQGGRFSLLPPVSRYPAASVAPWALVNSVIKVKLSRSFVLALLTFTLAQGALAQSDSSARVGISVKADSVAAPSSPARPPSAQRDSSAPSWKNIGIGMLLGSGIGVGVGFGAALAITSGNYPDHTEDGLVYMYLGVLGGIVGLLAGMVAGAMHR